MRRLPPFLRTYHPGVCTPLTEDEASVKEGQGSTIRRALFASLNATLTEFAFGLTGEQQPGGKNPKAGTERGKERWMHQEGKPLWKRLFDDPGGQEREEKVLQYIAHRLHSGARLDEAVEEDYVRRNLSRARVGEVVSNPELVRAVREHMKSAFESGRLDTGASSSDGRTTPSP